MQHSYIDRYANLDSFVHRVDARLKIIFCFALIILTVLTPSSSFLPFLLYGIILSVILVISKIPIVFVIKRSLVVVPFVILASIFVPFIKGVPFFVSVVIKSYLSMISMILLVSTVKFTALLKALQDLRLPKIFIMILSFMYRYSFLLIDELERMLISYKSRSFGKEGRFKRLKVFSNIIGVLFIRSYERAERVYLAMCSRGFQGEVK